MSTTTRTNNNNSDSNYNANNAALIGIAPFNDPREGRAVVDEEEEAWGLLEAFECRGETMALQHVHARLHQCVQQRLGIGLHGSRRAMDVFPPRLLLRVLGASRDGRYADAVVGTVSARAVTLVAILNAAYVKNHLTHITTQFPPEERPPDLDELAALYVWALGNPSVLPHPARRHLMAALGMLVILLRPHTSLVSCILSLFSPPPQGSCLDTEMEMIACGDRNAAACGPTVELWGAVMDALLDTRFLAGPIRRAQCRKAMAVAMHSLLMITEEVLRYFGVASSSRLARVVVKGLHLMGQGHTEEPAELSASFFELLPESSLWKWAGQTVAGAAYRHMEMSTNSQAHPGTAQEDNEEVLLAQEFITTSLSLCTLLTPATEQLLSASLRLVLEHLIPRHTFSYGYRIVTSVIQSAGMCLMSSLPASCPLLLQFHQALEAQLNFLLESEKRWSEGATVSGRGSSAAAMWEDEGVVDACEGITALAEALLPTPIPDMDPTDDVDEYKEFVEAVMESNSEKKRVFVMLSTYFSACCHALLSGLSALFYASIVHSSEALLLPSSDAGHPLAEMASAINRNRNIYDVRSSNAFTAMWVASERVHELVSPTDVVFLSSPQSAAGVEGTASNRAGFPLGLACRLVSGEALLEYMYWAAERGGMALEAMRFERGLIAAAVRRITLSAPGVPPLLPSCLASLMQYSWETCGDAYFASDVAEAMQILLVGEDHRRGCFSREAALHVAPILWSVIIHCPGGENSPAIGLASQDRARESAIVGVAEALTQLSETFPEIWDMVATSLPQLEALKVSPLVRAVLSSLCGPLTLEAGGLSVRSALTLTRRALHDAEHILMSDEKWAGYAGRVTRRFVPRAAAVLSAAAPSHVAGELLRWWKVGCENGEAQAAAGLAVQLAESGVAPAMMRAQLLLEVLCVYVMSPLSHDAEVCVRRAALSRLLSVEVVESVALPALEVGDAGMLCRLADVLDAMLRRLHPSSLAPALRNAWLFFFEVTLKAAATLWEHWGLPKLMAAAPCHRAEESALLERLVKTLICGLSFWSRFERDREEVSAEQEEEDEEEEGEGEGENSSGCHISASASVARRSRVQDVLSRFSGCISLYIYWNVNHTAEAGSDGSAHTRTALWRRIAPSMLWCDLLETLGSAVDSTERRHIISHKLRLLLGE